MTPSTSNHTQAQVSNKKRKQAVSAQSSPAPRKRAREDRQAEESSEKDPHSPLEDSERTRRRVDKGKAKANADDAEGAEPSSATAQPTSGTSRAKQPKEQETRSSSAKKGASKDASNPEKDRASKPNRRKLAPQRPWPSVPTSSNATGPHSAWAEGKNKFLISRKTTLGTYLRRCKECVLVDGYKTLYLSATSAAIPTLLIIATSLSEMLPYAKNEIRVEYKTGTVRCMDEILPDDDPDDEDDPTIQSELVERKIASLSVTFTIGDGKKEITGKEKRAPKKLRGAATQNAQKAGQGAKSKGTSQPEMSSDDEMFE